MKKILFLAVVCVAMASCKKDYECSCVSVVRVTAIDSDGFFSSQTETTVETVALFDRVKEEDAKMMCDDLMGTEETVNTEDNITTTELRSTTCELEEK